MLVDSGSSKPFVDPKLIRGVENRRINYTEINPSMDIKAADHNAFFGTPQGILLVVESDTQNGCRTVKLPIVLVQVSDEIFFYSFCSSKRCQKYFQ